MTAEVQTTQPARAARGLRAVKQQMRALARRLLWRLAPSYARRRATRLDAVAAVPRLEAELELVGERHDEQIERLEDLTRELILTAEALRREIGDVDAATASTRDELRLLQAELNALPFVAGGQFEMYESPAGSVYGYRSAAAVRGGDSGYVAFEELFRGPAERVTESQRPYAALVRDHQPVLDVGCGRGEFLALLAAEGISAHGVDSDAGMVERSRALGVQATLGDANEYLQAVGDGTLGTIFSAQLIEHLPLAELQRLIELSRRKLRPGGLFIAETVNPNRIASLKTFWVDLTHRHPIFPEVALALAAIAGFEPAYVFAPMYDDFERARLHSPAYAVVATAPRPQVDVG